MANTYTQIFIHAIFVVKGRNNLIKSRFKDELYSYIAGIIKNKESKLLLINGMPDHVHLLIGLNPENSLSDLIKEVKRCSSIFINENKFVQGRFEWQPGFGAFSYSKSQVKTIYKYIENQVEHHKQNTFREEYIDFLKKFEVEYDERYIFEDFGTEENI
jgi:putative transposase